MLKNIKIYFARREFNKRVNILKIQESVRKVQVDLIEDNISMYTLEYVNESGYSIIYDNKTYEIHSVIYIPRNSSNQYRGENI